LQFDHPKFNPENCPAEFFVSLMQMLQDCSDSEINEVLDPNHHRHRHEIRFEETSEQRGFVGAPGVDPDQVGYAWQFAVGDHNDWRIHGFLIIDTFYIVWLDPLHKLYQKYNR
jgi:hypothetical protein